MCDNGSVEAYDIDGNGGTIIDSNGNTVAGTDAAAVTDADSASNSAAGHDAAKPDTE